MTTLIDFMTRVKGWNLYAFSLVLAVVAANFFTWILFAGLNGRLPAHNTLVASLTALAIAAPMLYVALNIVWGLTDTNASLADAEIRLKRTVNGLACARNDLQRINDELENRVAKRTEDLQIALQEAKKANAAKTLFLANMSHELRTPLNSIIGFSELISRRRELFGTAAEEKLDEYSAAIHRSGCLLNALVSDLLDLSKIECGQYEIVPEPLIIETVVNDVVSALAPLQESRGQRIDVDLRLASTYFHADYRAIHQALSNLLTNALKYSPDRAVVYLRVENNPKGTTFIVKDHGIGMSQDAIAKATQPFSRFSDAHIASGQSVGLGLSIVSDLCALHDGALTLTSVEGKGTTARIHFPAGKSASETLQALSEAS